MYGFYVLAPSLFKIHQNCLKLISKNKNVKLVEKVLQVCLARILMSHCARSLSVFFENFIL